jgi:glutamine phosphoribosylpyrophosphate amidotransferase
MKFICDAPGGKSWFRLETIDEAAAESATMRHAVEKYFRNEALKATASFRPASSNYIEQEIGLKAHLQREMPIFLSLRDMDGAPLATAMLPPGARDDAGFRPIIVGAANGDAYLSESDAIETLGRHFGLALDRERCFPYRRN